MLRLIPKILQPFQRSRLDLASLQFRLTLGLTAVFILGLGSVASWTSWKMQQILIVTHKQNVDYLANRFPKDVELYSEMLPVDMGLQKTINRLAAPNLLMWVKSPRGTLLAQSNTLNVSPPILKGLMSLTEISIKPQVYQINDRYLVLCGGTLTVKGAMLGKLYVAQDVTADQIMLITSIRSLMLVSTLAVIATMIAISLYVRRSLQPLREMSQIAGAISAEDLGEARLQLSHTPSEVKELAQTFDMMLSRLSDAWERQRQFVSNVSHELRTPLTLVQGYLQSILRRSHNLSEPQREALETAASEAERTIQLLQDLLDLARADNGYMHFHLEPVNLTDLAQEVATMAEQFSNRIINVTAPREMQVTTDQNRLKQVLINLIDNAVKYSEPDQPVSLQLSQTDQQVVIQVCDRGDGIALPQQVRIFERFYRVDEARARSTGGVGLGLSIVKTLVEGMGGNVTVRSKLNEGSTFTVTLPG